MSLCKYPCEDVISLLPSGPLCSICLSWGTPQKLSTPPPAPSLQRLKEGPGNSRLPRALATGFEEVTKARQVRLDLRGPKPSDWCPHRERTQRPRERSRQGRGDAATSQGSPRAISNTRAGTGASKGPSLLTSGGTSPTHTWILDFRLPDCETVHFSHLSPDLWSSDKPCGPPHGPLPP